MRISALMRKHAQAKYTFSTYRVHSCCAPAYHLQSSRLLTCTHYQQPSGSCTSPLTLSPHSTCHPHTPRPIFLPSQELVGVCDALVQRPASQELLELALTQDVLRIDLDSVADHLADVKSILGKAAMQPIVTRIMSALQDGTEAPKPRYFAPSVIQPDLRYWVETKGHPLPLPPPPPPRGGQEARGNGAAAAPAASAPPPVAPAASAPKPAAAAAPAGVPVPVPIPMPQPVSVPAPAAAARSIPVPVPQPVPAASVGQGLRAPVPAAQPASGAAAAGAAAPRVAIPVPIPAPQMVPTVTVAFQPAASQAGAPAAVAGVPIVRPTVPTGYQLQRQRAAVASQSVRPPQAPVAQPVYSYPAYISTQQGQPVQQQQQWMQQQPHAMQMVQPMQVMHQVPVMQQLQQPQAPSMQQIMQQQMQHQQVQQRQYAQAAQPHMAHYGAMGAGAGAAARAGFAPGAWACSVCTYEHKGSEAGFLACAMCGTERTQ